MTDNGYLAINYTYNVGTINSSKYKGGILGSADASCSMSNSYFLEVGPMLITGNRGSYVQTNNIGKYEKAKLKKQSSFPNFDFSNVWQIQNDSYPTFRWENKLSSIPKINSVTGNVTNWTNQNVTLTINATGNITNYSFDDGKTWQTSNKKTYTQNTTGINVRIKDSSGNIGLYGQIIDIDKIEKVAPIISSVTGNATNWTNQNVTLTVNASDSTSGIASANAYSFDNGNTWQTENTKTYNQNTNEIIVKVKDNLGNISTYSQTINIDKIDKIAPTIEITPNGADTSQSKEIIITVSDNGGSRLSNDNNYQYQLGTSNTVVPTGTWKNYTTGTAFKIGEELTGDYYLWVKYITDNAGNKSDYIEYRVSNKFTFDNTPAELEISTEKYIIDEENYIKNIDPKTNLAKLLENLTCNYEIKVYDKNNKELTGETLIGTGMKIKVKDQQYILTVKGDVNGSGTVDLNDAIKVLQHRAGGENPQLTGPYLKAAQLTIPGKVSLNDVIKIMRYKATNGQTEL
mgnify:CR=1 FL=1